MTTEKVAKELFTNSVLNVAKGTKAGKAIANIVESPVGGFVKSKAEATKQVEQGLIEYQNMAKNLGQNIKDIKDGIYQ